MIQRLTTRDEAGTVGSGKGSRDVMTGRQVFDVIHQVVPFSQALIVSTLPRGSVQIVQQAKCPESLSKAYTRDLHRDDRVAWQAILKGQSSRASDCWTTSEFQSSPYLYGLLQPLGLLYAVGVPLSA